MAAVEFAVYNLLGVFHKYSAKEGDALTLNKTELSTFLLQELPCCYRDDAMVLLDLDGDGEVDFLEFIEFITEITTELQDMYIHTILNYKRIPKFGAQTLTEKAIVTLIKCLEDKNNVPEVLRSLDSNRKAGIDFKEFMAFVANFAVAVEFTFVNLPKPEEGD
ncbi:protein S100-B-like isoform X2 [Ascaphus truei]|uniref:protein S100-B-like isoform X2 n=1 Tax=Ascaphus truei TaxID=8439 RepID=UPI003F59B9BE